MENCILINKFITEKIVFIIDSAQYEYIAKNVYNYFIMYGNLYSTIRF